MLEVFFMGENYSVGQVVTKTEPSIICDEKAVDLLVVIADMANKIDEIHKAIVGKKK